MTETIDLPSNDDFISEGEDISDGVRNLSNNTISQLLKISPKNYDERILNWFKNTLPSIWKTILSSSHPSRPTNLTKEITIFTEKYCLLCVHTNLIPSIILAITESFDNSFRQGLFYEIDMSLSEDEINSIIDNVSEENSNDNNGNDSILLPASERPSSDDKKRNLILIPLISQIVQSGMFQKVKELYRNDELKIDKISAIVQLFSCIESSISKKIVSAILPQLIDITIEIIKSDYLNSNSKPVNNEVPQMCKFLSTYARMIPQISKIDSILKVLCELSSEKIPVKMRLNAISDMIHIIETVGLGNSAEEVKTAMIDALTTSSQSSMLNSICSFLPKLAKAAQFTDEDLHNLLLKARNGDEKLVSALVDVINSLNRYIDNFANELTNYDILSPSLYCSVIGKTQDENVTRVLFHQLLSLTDKLMNKKGSITHVELNDRLKEHMNEDNVDVIKLLTFLFLCAPNVDTVCDFIIRAFSLPELPNDLIPNLMNFSRKLNDFNSIPSINALFNVLLERLKNKEAHDIDFTKPKTDVNYNQFTDSLVQVVTQWIRMSNDINSETSKILKDLSELNFSHINDYVPCLANELISKCSNVKNNIDFLFKVLNDSVPPKHSNWLIGSIFQLIHSNEDLVNKCYEIIMGHLQSVKNGETENKDRYVNGVYLLYNAVIYEADFFMIGEQNFGFTQSIILHLQTDNVTEMTVSFHPFHSTRRVYAEVANALNVGTDQFQLMLNDEEQEKILTFNAPLETVSTMGNVKEEKKTNNNSENEGAVIYKEVPIELRFQNNDDYQPNPKMYSTPFLNLLAPKISILFDLIEFHNNNDDLDFESQILFLIIKLFPQLNIVPKTLIQGVIVGKISLENAMYFIDSIRIFPYAIACATNNYVKEAQSQKQLEKDKNSQDDIDEIEDENKRDLIKQFIIELASHNYDIVSLSIACRALHSVKFQVGFTKQQMKKCLLECQSRQIRTITSKFISPSLTSDSDFIELIDYALLKENRAKTKPFFECISRKNLPKEIFVPFYKKLEQFEISYYSDIDQTFTSLLSLIPQTQETVELTIKRLFSSPTCRNETVPFVQTSESWIAALKFIETSLAIPHLHTLTSLISSEVTQRDLSSDYTFKGRIGIVNMGSTCYMNSLLQLLNTFQRVSLNIISKDTEKSQHMTPFILEFRNCLAKLRYLRGTTLTLNELSKTIDSKFNPTLQQDIEEFFNLIINKISEELKEEDDISNQMKIELSYNISVDNEVVSSSKETVFYLLLQTMNLSNLTDSFELYFEDENIDYPLNGQRVPASRWISIQKWPDYLVIQLQRWEYKLETMEKHKLVHEFDFPVELKGDDIKIHHAAQKCDSDYTLSGVAIHQGTADQGHYVTIVLGDDDEWYFCNDNKIEYFDINDLATFAYGQTSPDDSQTPDEIYTGYLLFYKKVGLEKVKINSQGSNNCFLPIDLEEKIDQENAKNWPSTIFYSNEFVDYARRMIINHQQNPQMLDIAFTVLFKIAIHNEFILNQWCYMMINQILNIKNEDDKKNEVFDRFFDYIENEIGTSLAQMFAISENVTNDLSGLINFALKKVPNSTKPIKSIMKCVPEGQFLKRMFCSFLFDTISNAYQNLVNTVDWSNEDETLTMMLNILSIQLSKEVQRQISKQHIYAMNNVLSLFIDVLRVKGCCDTVLNVFDIARMNKINYIYKKCENFTRLMLNVNSIQADFFYETPDATPATLELLSQILPQQSNNETEPSEQLILDLAFLFPSIEELIFCQDKKVRSQVCNCLMEMTGKKDIDMINYFKEALIKDQFTPILKEENTIALFAIGQFPRMQEIIDQTNGKENNIVNDDDDENYPNEAACIEFADVILRICCVTPNVLLSEFRSIVNMYLSSNHSVLKRKLLKLVHHIIAYDKSIIGDKNYDDLIDKIMTSNVTSTYATQLLWAFKEKADNSVLSGACVEYYLTSEYDENAEILIKLLKNGLHPIQVEIPPQANDFIKLRIANELWNAWPDKHEELADFMLSAFSLAKPYRLYQNSITLTKTIEILKVFCPDKLNSKMEELSKESN